MAAPETRSASRSIGLVGLVNVGMTVVGLAQAFVVGWLFGTTESIEIYFAASTFYLAILNLMQTGQISEVVTPIYHQLKESSGEKLAYRLISILLNWMVLIAFGLAGITFLVADRVVPWAVPGFESERLGLCISMFCWIIPLVGFQVAASILFNFAAAEKKFVGQEVGRLIATILGLACVVALAGTLDAWAMVVSLWVTSLATFFVLIYIAWATGYRHQLRFSDPQIELRAIIRTLPSLFSYVTLAQLYSLVLTAGLSTLPQGYLAIFTYARRVFTRVNGVLARPISVVFFNHYSADVASQKDKVTDLVARTLRISLIASTFAAIAILTAGFPGLKFLWLSERFPESDVRLTYLFLSILSFTAFVVGPGLIYRKINMSHQLVRPQYRALCLVMIALNLTAYFFIKRTGFSGAVGVVILSSFLITLASAVVMRRRIPGQFAFYRLSDCMKCVAVLVLASSPIVVIQQFFGTPDARLGNLIVTLASLAVSMAVGLGVAWYLQLEEAIQGAIMIRDRLVKRFRSASPSDHSLGAP